jgi:hypothetical protein
MPHFRKPLPILLSVLLACCNGGGPTVDTRGVDLPVTIDRLDHELFHAPPPAMRAACDAAQLHYGEFFDIYVEEILRLCAADDPKLPRYMNAFVHSEAGQTAQKAIDSVFADLEDERLLFKRALERLHVVFPNSVVPRLVAYNAGFAHRFYATDSVLGFGLEWFIGADHPIVAMLPPESFPQFVRARMEPHALIPTALKGWLLVNHTQPLGGKDLLANLVEAGRVAALLQALLPEVPAHLRLEMTPGQLAWCEANEAMIWKEVLTKEMLFSTRAPDIGRLMNDGPFTNGFPRESPGQLGHWIGLRMVEAYMKANPRATFADLFALEDTRLFLKHYRPR